VILSEEEESANVLKLLKDKIKKDFVVMNGDFLTDLELSPFLDKHYLHEGALSLIFKEIDLSQK